MKDSKSAPKAIEINVADFPPLGSPDDSVVPTPGYKTEYQKYSIDDVIGIVKNIREAHLPEGIHAVSILLKPFD